jgi:cyclase
LIACTTTGQRCLAGATLALVLASAGALAAADAFEVELRPVCEGVFVAIRPDVFREPYESNTTLIINETDVVVVDGGSTPLTARRVIAALKKLTDKPVRVLINTHWHYDHFFGNQEYAAAFPGVEILSHPLARQDMLERASAAVHLPSERLAAMEAALKSGRDAQGAPLSESERQKDADYLVREAELTHFRLTLPTLTVEHELVLRRGQREICVSYLGRGHTNADLVVLLPQEKVLVTGDLIVIPISSGFGCFPREWAQTMRRLDALDFATLIPGHGDVQHDRGAVRLVIDVLDYVNGAVEAAVRSGASLEETRRRLDFTPFLERCAAADPRAAAFFLDFFARPVAEAAFREAQAARSVGLR